MMKFSSACLATLLLVVVASATSPSLNVGLGQAPLQSIVDKALPPIIQALNGLTFPTISGQSHVGGIIGDVDYTVSSLKLASISTDAPTISTKSGLGIGIANAELKIDAHFEVKESDWPHVSTHGDVEAEISETTIDIAVEIDAAAKTGAPTLKITACNVHIGKIKLHFSDNFFSWLENLISDLFEKTLRDKIASSVQSELTTKITMVANEAFAKLPMTDNFGTWAELQWRLASNAVTSTEDFTMSLAADITTQNVPITPPGKHHALPTEGTRMLDLWLDEYLLDSAFWAAQQSGVIDKKVTNGDIFPIDTPIGKLINETIYKIMEGNPLLEKLLPYESSLITFQFNTENAPTVDFTETTDAHFRAPFQINVGAVDNALDIITVEAPVAGSIAMNLQPGSAGWILVPSIETLTFTVTNITSAVGPLKEPAKLDKIINVVLNEIAVPYINELFAKGFALPTLPAGLKLSEPALTFGDGFLHIGADVDAFTSVVTKVVNKIKTVKKSKTAKKAKKSKTVNAAAPAVAASHKVTASNVAAILANMVTSDNVQMRLSELEMLAGGDACLGEEDTDILCSDLEDDMCKVSPTFVVGGKACSQKLIDGEAATKACYKELGLSTSCAAAQTEFNVCGSQSSCAFVCGVLNDCEGCNKCTEGSDFQKDCSQPLYKSIGFTMYGGVC